MAEYCLRVFRLFSRFPQQILVYVGDAPLRMATEIRSPALNYSYRIVDIRDLDGERLLESPRVGDNIIAILTRLPDLRASVHRVMGRIASLGPGEREAALERLLILAGLRNLGRVVEEDARKMPILNDIRDHEVLGEEYKNGAPMVLRPQNRKAFRRDSILGRRAFVNDVLCRTRGSRCSCARCEQPGGAVAIG